jgi:hypothetical protein
MTNTHLSLKNILSFIADHLHHECDIVPLLIERGYTSDEIGAVRDELDRAIAYWRAEVIEISIETTCYLDEIAREDEEAERQARRAAMRASLRVVKE